MGQAVATRIPPATATGASLAAVSEPEGEGTVYEYSRDVYRRLRTILAPDRRNPGAPQRTLYAGCLEMVVEMAKEGGRARRPAERLFGRVRHLFPPHAQLHAYHLIEREMSRVSRSLLEEAKRGGRGNLLTCAAATRRNKPCQREPLRGSRYCPSHRHLENVEATPGSSAAPAAGRFVGSRAMSVAARHVPA